MIPTSVAPALHTALVIGWETLRLLPALALGGTLVVGLCKAIEIPSDI